MQQSSNASLPVSVTERDVLIRVEHLTKSISTKTQKTTLLSDITFGVPFRSLFAVNGPSGSGKSTLLNMLTGIDRPTSGRVFFEGQELRGRSEDGLARWRGQHVGIIFQFFQLIPTLTALENVLLALELGGANKLSRYKWYQRAQECLDIVGIGKHGHRLPSELSGGEQQRVAIARALVNDPPVLVADEPTGNLDSRTARQIFDLLASMRSRDKTVIYVTHDHQLAALATSRIELLDGQIVGMHHADAFSQAEEREQS